MIARRWVAGMIVAVALMTVATWLSPLGTVVDADALTCGPATQSRAAVAVVVDFGENAPERSCVALPMTSSGTTSATGIDALRAAGYTLRIEGGFLCGIDGQPATGCATGSGFDGWYWRYFKADPGGAWRYSSVGFGYRLGLTNGCAVEGWVWSDQPAATVAPRGGVPAIRCPSLPAATTTTRVPATTAPSPKPSNGQGGAGSPGAAPGSGASEGATVGGAISGGSGAEPQGGASAGGTAAGAGGVAGDQSAGGADPSAGSDGSAGDGAAVGDSGERVLGAVAESQGSDADAAESTGASKRNEMAGARRSRVKPSGGSGSAVGVVVALVLVAGLGLFAAMKARSRRLVE